MIDVLIVGGGNAALCAALMAREAGASVLLVEASPREWRAVAAHCWACQAAVGRRAGP